MLAFGPDTAVAPDEDAIALALLLPVGGAWPPGAGAASGGETGGDAVAAAWPASGPVVDAPAVGGEVAVGIGDSRGSTGVGEDVAVGIGIGEDVAVGIGNGGGSAGVA